MLVFQEKDWKFDTLKNYELSWEECTTKFEKREIKRGIELDGKIVSFTVKETFTDQVSNLDDKFDNQIQKFGRLSFSIRNQYRYYRERKQNLEDDGC